MEENALGMATITNYQLLITMDPMARERIVSAQEQPEDSFGEGQGQAADGVGRVVEHMVTANSWRGKR